MPRPIHHHILQILLLVVGAWLPRAVPKSTIEPCSTSDSCSALVGYTLYTDLQVSEVASLFGVDPIALLLANAVDVSYPDVENHILPSQLFVRVPVRCTCADGIRKSAAVNYRTRPSDTLATISAATYGGLVSAEQIKVANPSSGISDPSVILGETQLSIPLPCTCFNNSDNNLPAVYMSYVVRESVDTLSGIAARYHTTLTDLMAVNALSTPEIKDGDILAIPLSACASNFPSYAKDYGLVVPNGSYALTAGDCVQCSCGPGSRNLYCTPATLPVSCSSMQCRNSNLMVGNITAQQTAGGCNVTSCGYSGFVNGSISTTLLTSLQPRCPGPQQFPALQAPPTVVPDSTYSPAPSPSESGGAPGSTPRSTVPSTGVVGFTPAGGPTGSVRGSSGACSLTNHLTSLKLILGLVVGFVLSIEL
ncbi:lysm domain-containing GPI-anchored protein 1 [Phtheirospermum japonicum]|uniref:Lysm domain-containing GPI-anchored protein 1 n=1 Tax=Phtheirospermum japonicum TaxID=374723 RepID=A0A830BQP0_9LAMI|nr:lysm domain-containing GPI-anchored protein 1 [Phtheirospermum japonicum]